jgi:hypothetical protein
MGLKEADGLFHVCKAVCPCIRAVMQLLRPILAAIAAESYTTVDESHWRWTRITSQVRIPVFNVLTLGSTC